MNKFEEYLINSGMNFQVAGRYGRVADKYIHWLKANDLKAHFIKRSKFLEWIQECRAIGNSDRTIEIKETVIKHYYYFLGTKNNPAQNFLKKRKAHTLPPSAIDKADLLKVYESLNPKSPAEYRNRCMLGFVLFQGFRRTELSEIRVSDLNLEKCEVFIQGQPRTNSRRLKLEPAQVMHLHNYCLKFRNDFLCNKKSDETDKLFLSKGTGDYLNNSITLMLSKLKKDFPFIGDLRHIRGSVITSWQKNEGIMEAMIMAGHRYISSTQRYTTNKYEELHEQLKSIHPLEQLNLSAS